MVDSLGGNRQWEKEGPLSQASLVGPEEVDKGRCHFIHTNYYPHRQVQKLHCSRFTKDVRERQPPRNVFTCLSLATRLS